MRALPLGVAGVALTTVAAVGVSSLGDDYTVDVVMPAATNLVAGSRVQINGADVGSVQELAARSGKAVVTVSVDDEHAPLPDGTRAIVSYKATMGERIVELMPGDEANPPLRDGALIESQIHRVELDQVLAALDAPTRKRLSSLLDRLSTTLEGNEDDVRTLLQTGGPVVETLGELLKAVGTDGPAIRNLVIRLANLNSVLAERDADLAASVDGLATAATEVGARREALSATLDDLPETLQVAEETLDDVPATVEAAAPLLADLRPATARLPEIAGELGPLLTDLRPTVAALRPTLRSVQTLLGRTPALLGLAGTVVPQADEVLQEAGPAITYLRPYTPELVGWLANWGSAAANYDSNGHYLRAFVQEGGSSLNVNPGVVPPGVTATNRRLPGESEGQRWTDAHGSGMQ